MNILKFIFKFKYPIRPLMRWQQTKIKNNILKEKIIEFNLKCSGENCYYSPVKNKL